MSSSLTCCPRLIFKMEKEITAEETLDEYFPKGNKDRGKVLVIFALAKIEGSKQEGERIKEIVLKWIKEQRCYSMGHILDADIKQLLRRINKMENAK